MRDFLKGFGKIAVLVILAMVLVSNEVFAADVFDTIQAKMIGTVKDVRKIVYIIAGFGLVMFSVLAIFNKISFKHLSYIMISLTILALMMPFIEYFSGYKIEDNELNYDNYLRNDDASITGSDTQQVTDCVPGSCPEDMADNLGENSINNSTEASPNGENSEVPPEANPDLGLDLENPNSNTDPLAPEAPDIAIPNGMDANGDGIETAQEQKMSFKELMQAGLDGAKNFVDNVNNAIDAVEYAKGAVQGVVAGAQAAKDVITGDGNVLEKIVGLTTVASNTATNVGSNISGALGEGSTVTGYLGMEGLSQGLSDARDGVSQGVGEANDWGNMGAQLGGIGSNAGYAAGRIFGN